MMMEKLVRIAPRRDRVNCPTRRIELPGQVSISSPGLVDINGTAFMPSGVRIDSPHGFIYIDPVAVSDPVPAELVLITHGHPDHFSLADIRMVCTPETVIVAPVAVARRLRRFPVRVIAPGNHVVAGSVSVEAIPAYTTSNVFLWIKSHPKRAGNVGYVIDVPGVRILHAGDTERTDELASLSEISVALLPIGGENLTMDPASAASVVNAIRPVVAIPIHYEPGESAVVDEFARRVDPPVRVEELISSSAVI